MGTGQKTNSTNQFHFLIVGQGIAGSVLALSLMKSGYRVCVIDKPELSLSSKVAAGIWNPVVFKRLTKSWLADELVPELIDFYTGCENELNASFITKRRIIKPFTEEQEKNLWLKKAQSENAFLDPQVYEHFELSASQTIGSYSFVLGAGNLDVAAFLNATKDQLMKQQSFFEDTFQYGQLEQTAEGIRYKELTADNIVFCEGHLISKNPFFNWVPMKPAKGEVLTVKCEGLHLESHILNKGIFMMPLGNSLYKVGATYEWETLNDEPTPQKKEELSEKLKAVVQVPFEIAKHEAGVRPSVIDRRPVVGIHPTLNTHFIFNGFGTKAVMLAPYFAKQLVNYLQSGTVIDAEADVKRFIKG
jgi:glycine oxidase